MKTVYIKGLCCKGCANELKGIFEKVYGISNINVSVENCSVSFDGYISKKVILEALEGTKYEVEKIVSN
jgi:copper chaperone CopZ